MRNALVMENVVLLYLLSVVISIFTIRMRVIAKHILYTEMKIFRGEMKGRICFIIIYSIFEGLVRL